MVNNPTVCKNKYSKTTPNSIKLNLLKLIQMGPVLIVIT